MNEEKYFRLDDSAEPGWAKVQLLKKRGVNPWGETLWRVQVIEVVRPSTERRVRVGQKINCADLYLGDEMNPKKVGFPQ